MLKLTNNAFASIAAAVGAADTTITLTTGAAASFPELEAGDWFPITAVRVNDPSTVEIMRCTARSGDTLTVERAQEGTAAVTFSVGDIVEIRPTAGMMLEAFLQVGDFGLGGTPVEITMAELDNINLPSGWYRTVTVTELGPSLYAFMHEDVIHSRGPGWASQIRMMGVSGWGQSPDPEGGVPVGIGNIAYYRTGYVDGSDNTFWGPWNRLAYHDAIPTNSEIDARAQAVLDASYTAAVDHYILPGGQIIQFGTDTRADGGEVILPIAFPTACRAVVTTTLNSDGATGLDGGYQLLSKGTTSFTTYFQNYGGAGAGSRQGYDWIAIGE